MACHTSEAWLAQTAIRVDAYRATAAVTCTTRAAVHTRTFVIAHRIDITVVLIDIAWEDLCACTFCKHVARSAGTLVRLCSRVRAVAADTARIADAVVDVFA